MWSARNASTVSNSIGMRGMDVTVVGATGEDGRQAATLSNSSVATTMLLAVIARDDGQRRCSAKEDRLALAQLTANEHLHCTSKPLRHGVKISAAFTAKTILTVEINPPAEH